MHRLNQTWEIKAARKRPRGQLKRDTRNILILTLGSMMFHIIARLTMTYDQFLIVSTIGVWGFLIVGMFFVLKRK